MVNMLERKETADGRRTQIVEAAAACLARRGYARATMDEIAREAGLSKGLLYWYFPSKRELLLAVLEQTVCQTVQEAQRIAGERTSSAVEQLLDLVQMAVRLAANQRELLLTTVDFWGQRSHDAQVSALFDSCHRAFSKVIQGVLAEGVAEGELRPVNPEAMAPVLLGLYHGLLVQEVWGGGADWDLTSAALAGLLTQGLSAPRGLGRPLAAHGTR
ncbi:MAG: TetR/AcrR family transcriptional regulator [Chloroflexi bacterium]|nr:TetR/AcrR family transcriptional regulator [Chloroflexota bacterium]